MLPVLPAGQKTAPPAEGASLAQMALFDLHGKRHQMDEVKTKRVVVVCWAFWCNTWKSALPQLQALEAAKGSDDFTIWTVSVDGTYTDEIRPLVEAGHIHFPVLLDDGAWKRALGLRCVPTVLILDASRTVKKVYEGYPGNSVLVSGIRGVKSEREGTKRTKGMEGTEGTKRRERRVGHVRRVRRIRSVRARLALSSFHLL